MAYKKYHYRNGKKYGPYYYESYRDKNGVVKKKYVGTENPNEKNKESNIKKKSGFVGRNVFSFFNFSNRRLFLSIFLIIILLFLVFNFNFSNPLSGNVVNVPEKVVSPFYKMTGFVVSGAVEDEVVLEEYDKDIDLKVIESPKIGNVMVGKNKNDRMEFFGKKNIRLYFDLLNYSEFVSGVVETGYGFEETGYGLTGNFIKLFSSFLGLTGRVVEDSLNQVNIGNVKEIVDDLSSDELDVISDEAVVEFEEGEFEVVVDESLAKEIGVDYKWGYNVVLKDLNFLAKIEVSSDEDVVVYSEDSLRIGRNLLSFSDLVEEGYSVRFESPEFGIDLNESESNTYIREIGNVSGVEVNDSYELNEIVNESVEDDEIEDVGFVFGKEKKEKVEEDKEEKNKEEKVKKDKDVETGYGISGNVVLNFFSLIGRVVGVTDNGVGESVVEIINETLDSVEVEDVEYLNKVVVYIERDFEGVVNGGGVEYGIGDVVFLDPSLIVIPISDAEHLDINRSYVSNIYNETVVQDDVWSEVIGDREYVRVSFNQELDRSKDVSVYARVVNWSNDSFGNIEVYLDGGEEIIAKIENVSSEGFYSSYLDGSSGAGLGNDSASVFDLKILNSVGVEFDWIVDPTPGATNVTNCITLNTANTYYQLNESITNNTLTTDCIIINNQNITLDCDGYSISSTQNFTGVYSNQFNTTIKNCNISMGSGGNTNAIGIEMGDSADNSSVINNTIIGEMDYGIYFAVSSNGPEYSLIENNTVDVSTLGVETTGIYLRESSYNTLKNNNAETLAEYGILLYSSSNNTLTSNTGTSNSNIGIYLVSASNNNLTSNTGTSNPSYGIYLNSASNNTLTSNIGTSNSSYGIYLYSSSNNNTLTNNTGTSNSNIGIYLESSSRNNLASNIGTSNSSYGIYLISSSNNNTLTNNTGTSNSSYGTYLYISNNNIIINHNSTGYSTGSYGIAFRSANNNLIKDCVNITGIAGDVLYVITLSVNNTFVNCSYRTINGVPNETVLAGGSLIRKWYYRAYVRNGVGNPVSNINVTTYNSSGEYQFNYTTNGSGYTPRAEIIEYVNVGGTRSYYNNYSIMTQNVNYTLGNNAYNVSAWLNNLQHNLTVRSNWTTSIFVFDSEADSEGDLLSNGTIYPNQMTYFYANYSSSDFGDIGQIIWNTSDIDQDISNNSFVVDFIDCELSGKKNCPVVAPYDWPSIDVAVFYPNGTLKYANFNSRGTFHSVEVGDLNNDGFENEFVMVSSFGIWVMNESGEVWDGPDYGESGPVKIGDIDHDGIKDDIVFVPGVSNLYVYNTSDGVNWSIYLNITNIGNLAYSSELYISDFDSDGNLDDIAFTSYADMVVLNDSGDLLFNTSSWGYIEAMEPIDLDHDGFIDEIIFEYSNTGEICAYQWNGTYGVSYKYANRGTDAIWCQDFQSGINLDIYEINKIDLDNDGFIDDFVYSGEYNVLFALDNDSNQLWNFTHPEFVGNVNTIHISDINDDSYDEIIFSENNSRIFVLNTSGDLLFKYTIGFGDIGYYEFENSGAIKTSDLNNDGINDIAVSTVQGHLYILQEGKCYAEFDDGNSYNATWNDSSGFWFVNRNFSSSGNYSWNITCEKGGYVSSVSSEMSAWINGMAGITIVSPLNGESINKFSVDFNLSISDSVFDTCVVSLNNFVYNYTMTAFNTTYFTFTNSSIGDGSYIANFSCNDSFGNVNNSASVDFSVNTTLDIAQVISINRSGSSGGVIARGDNVTINATIVNATEISNVWAIVWETFIGGNIIWQGFLNFIGSGIWSAIIETNWTFPMGLINYTVYVNDTLGQETNLSGNFTMVEGYNLSDCGNLGEANGVYILINNVSASATCFNVTAENVTINCNGYEINYSYGGVLGYGVYSNKFNTSVRNCVIREGEGSVGSKHGVFFDNGGNNSYVDNNSIYMIGGNSSGIAFLKGYDNVVSNNSINLSSAIGVSFFNNSYGNIIVNNNISGFDNYGIYLDDGESNNSVKDSDININGDGYVIYADGNINSGSWLKFLNVSFNKSDVVILDSDFKLINQYSLDVNVNNSASQALNGANVTITNSSGVIEWSELTNASGWMPTRLNLTEYVQNYTGEENKSYATNYSIYTTLTDYVDKNDSLNLTGSSVFNVSMFSSNYNRSALGAVTNKIWVNYNEDVNLEINITAKDIGRNSLSEVWANIVKPDGSSENVNLIRSLEDRIVGSWHLDNKSFYGENSTQVYDFSGLGNNGSVGGGNATWNTSGKLNGAYDFDGDGDYIEVANNNSLNFGTGNFSLSLWFKVTNPENQTAMILSKRSASGFYHQYNLFFGSSSICNQFNPGKKVSLVICDTSIAGSCSCASSSSEMNDEIWHHIVGVVDANVTLYVDGVLVEKRDRLNRNITNVNSLKIGSLSGSDGNYFNGSIDEIMIFNRSLTALEINELNISRDRYNSSFTNTSAILGDYAVMFKANLTTGIMLFETVDANFSVQNTSIEITPFSLVVNTTDVMNVWGWINRTNNSESWSIDNNLFLIKINNVSVSSDVYNDSNFTGNNGNNVNISDVVKLNLSSAGSIEGYSDDFTSQKYLSDNFSNYNVGYDSGRDAVFSYNHMSGVGNITYKFSSVTKFYNASIYAGTVTSSDDSGGNTSVWYSYDNISWVNIDSSINLGSLIGGNVNVKGNGTIYLMIQSDTHSGANENPVVNLTINYTNYNYEGIGNFVSAGVNLSDVTYTVLSWKETLNGGDVKLQIRGSDNGSSWDGWSSNYTNSLTNDISGFNKDFIQYRAWLQTSNLSKSPVLSEVNISYFNASTNSTGGYDYNVTIPTDTLGVQALEVSVLNNPTTGIVGFNSTNITVWARTNVTYYIEKNYTGSMSNYSVYVNFTRTDTGDLIPGLINVSIWNGSSWSYSCNGFSQCIASWLVPNNLKYGNYTINITGSNVSAYYINSTNGFYDWLEEKNTTGAMYAENNTIGDFSAGEDYSFLWNVSINNSGNASMFNPYVSSVTPPTSVSITLVEYTPCVRIFPNESCNVVTNITLEGGASSGNHRVSLRTNWTNNDGSVGPNVGVNRYIAYTEMYVIIELNSTLDINESSVNFTLEHGNFNQSKFLVQSVGTDVVSGINLSFASGNISDGNNISGSWVSINPTSPADLAAGNSVEISFNVSVPLQTAPGNYSGRISVNSSNGGSKPLDLNIEVLENSSWYFSPTTNNSYNYSYSLNTAGAVGNYTIYNTGNVNLSFVVDYSPAGTSDYSAFGTDLFEENNNVGGLITNPTTANVSNGSSLIVPVYHKGYSSELEDVGVAILFSNSSAVPSADAVEDAFYIYEAAPQISGMWFILDGVVGNKAEVNKNVTIKVRATDDVSLNDTETKINVTYGATTIVLNTTSLRLTGGEYDGWTIINFTGNFTPSTSGIHYVVATVYDQTGKLNISSTFNFTSYATTSVQLSQNISNYSIADISKSNSHKFYVNYTVNNTGYVYAYTPNITFSKNDSYINISPVNFVFGNMANGSKNSYVFAVNVSTLTPSGTYNITTSSRWRNPDNSFGTDSEVLNVIVASNKSLSYSPNSLNMTVVNSGQNSTILIINNTGNDVLSGMNLNCYTVSLCDDFTFSANESNFSIGVNSSKQVNVTLIAPQGLTGGVYVGTINISGSGIANTIGIQAEVPESYTWNATPVSISSAKGASQVGNLQEIKILNTGNMNLVFNLSSSNNSIIQSNVSSIVVPVSTNGTFMINYSAPSTEAVYNEIISITNVSYNPTQINVSVNLTVTNINVTILYPTASNNISNVSSGDLIEVHTNATYGDEVLTNSSTWSVTIGGSACSNISYAYSSSLGYWNLTCNAPSISNGTTYNLTAIINHTTYGEISQTSPNSITYRDTNPPYFNVIRNNVNLGGNINLQVNVTDSVGVDVVWFEMTYPNGSVYSWTNETATNMSLSGEYYVFTGLTLNDAGEYLINYSANDSTGNFNSTVDWFEVNDKYNWFVKLLNYNNAGVSNVNISLYRPNSIYLMNNVTNSSGETVLNVNKRNYDLHAEILKDKVIIRNVNFTNLTENNISFNFHRMIVDELAETVSLHKVFQGIVSNSSGLSLNNVSAVFNYSGLSYDNSNELEVIKCSEWTYSDRSCNGTWSVIDSSINKDLFEVSGNSSVFSAYFLAENKCGNGLCEGTYGESTSSCSTDCTTSTGTTTTIVSGGGGGGGSSGLKSGDLDKIEEIVKSFLNIGGVKLETISIYKELFAGDTTTFRIKLRNTLANTKTISLSTSGDISPLLFFESTSIELAPKEERDVLIKIVAPRTAEPGNYDGDLILTAGNEEGSIPVTIRILVPEGKLLDVKIQPLTSRVAPGEILRLQTDILNLGKTKLVDVQFDLQLLDVETGEIITRSEEAFAVETSISTIKNLTIPEDTKTGRYMIKGTAYYSNVEQSMQASSIAYINVDYSLFAKKIFGIPVWAYFLALLIIALLVGTWFYVKWLQFKKKRFKTEVDMSKLPPASVHSGFIGKIAETGVRAFIDMNKLQTHTLIAGSTGSGKTVAAQGIIEEALMHKKGVIIFDPTAQWTGFLRKNRDKAMYKRYKYFDMKKTDAKAFEGSIKTISDPYELINMKKYLNRPGEITIFNVSHLLPKEIDVVVASTIEQVFKSEPTESSTLKTLIVYDEVHRLLPKFGGSGQGFIQLERGAREFRKWGIGLILISQVLSDFVGEVKANIGTEIQMGTRYEGDLERVSMKYGEDVLKSVVKEPVGTGMVTNAEYNSGRPYFVSFRPLRHSTKRLSKIELKDYEKYFQETEDLDYQSLMLEKLGVDILDLKLELKLAKQKVRAGQFTMAEMYLESLRPRFEDNWKSLGKKPMHLVKKKIDKAVVSEGILKAKAERKKYVEKNPEKVQSFDKDILDLKKLIETKKRNGKQTSKIEMKLEDLKKRIKPFKGRISANDSVGLKAEVDGLKKEINGL